MIERVLAAGEALFRAGEFGDEVFRVSDGSLMVEVETSTGVLGVATLGPGEVVGEITARVGGVRNATVRAAEPTRVQGFTAAEFDAWLDADPAAAQALAISARERIDRTRVTHVVAELVGASHPELIAELVKLVEWHHLDAGEELFRQGDVADAAYVLVAGQVHVRRVDPVDPDVVLVDTRVGRGDFVGEMGVIEDSPRNATVAAVRDSTLARIPKAAFHELTARHPQLMLPVVRKVIARVGEAGWRRPPVGAVAFVVLSPDAPAALMNVVADEVMRFGSVVHLDRFGAGRALHREDVTDAPPGSAGDARLSDLMHAADRSHDWLLLSCRDADSSWAERITRTADRVILVVSANPGVRERNEISRVQEYLSRAGAHELWLVRLETDASTVASGSAEFRESLGGERLLHAVAGSERSVRRVARLATGNGLGLACSGGGARAFGELGALRVLEDHGIVVDAVAGTSMGSVIAAQLASDDDVDRAIDAIRREFDQNSMTDLTLPLAALFGGRRLTERLWSRFGGVDIEDLRLPYTCISTNLTTAQLTEHRSGSLALAIRASVALPGVFPPVPHRGDLLVDGGVLENLPARPLRQDPGIGTVIAVDVAPPRGPRARSDFGMSLSGFRLFVARLRGRGGQFPGLAQTVVSSMLVGSAQARSNSMSNGDIDLLVPLNLSGIRLLDMDMIDEAIRRGESDARPVIEAWIAERSDVTSAP